MTQLFDIISEVHKREYVLPDFQRSFVWGPDDVRELLVSVLSDYFIGSFLFYPSASSNTQFQVKPIEGAPEGEYPSLIRIILDGQQRITSVYYALHEPDIPLKGRKSSYRFCIDKEPFLQNEINDAVRFVSRKMRKDTKKLDEMICEGQAIPFAILSDKGTAANWIRKLEREKKITPDEADALSNKLDIFFNYKINTIELKQDDPLNKIVETFERINRTGIELSVFDLMVAKLYKDGIKLRDLFGNFSDDYEEIANAIKPEVLLKILCLLRGNECKRKNILKTKPENFVDDWNRAVDSVNEGWERLKNIYGVFDFKKWCSYTTVLVPLSAILKRMKENDLQSAAHYNKVDKWYWTTVLGMRYDQAVDTQSYSDFHIIEKWLTDDNAIPKVISEFSFDLSDLDTDKKQSAIYKVVFNLIYLQRAKDFYTGNPPDISKISDDDHIFPHSIYRNDNVLNRTIISRETNRKRKRNKKPSEWIEELGKILQRNEIEVIFNSHFINPEGLKALENDDIDLFIKKRKDEIVDRIKNLGIPAHEKSESDGL